MGRKKKGKVIKMSKQEIIDRLTKELEELEKKKAENKEEVRQKVKDVLPNNQ